jgi:hypothetical protein
MPGAPELYQVPKANPLNLPDKSFSGFFHAVRVGSLSIPRVLDRLMQHRGLEIVALFPSSVTFLADASVLPCDHVNPL